jgi:hypothetical protein
MMTSRDDTDVAQQNMLSRVEWMHMYEDRKTPNLRCNLRFIPKPFHVPAYLASEVREPVVVSMLLSSNNLRTMLKPGVCPESVKTF